MGPAARCERPPRPRAMRLDGGHVAEDMLCVCRESGKTRWKGKELATKE